MQLSEEAMAVGNSEKSVTGHTPGHSQSRNAGMAVKAHLEDGSMNGLTNGTNHINGHSHDTTNGVHQGISEMQNTVGGTPVAICGMAMRLPGGIRNDKDLYNFLYNKGDARSTVGADRYNIDGYYSPYGKEGTVKTKHGYFLSDLDYSDFDLSMFSLSAAEVEQLDPNHRLTLEVVREAFESSGESNWRTKNIGTYVGLFTEDWQELNHKDNIETNTHRLLGGTDFALSNRIAYEYDLKGPSMVIKTACSSAGIGLHEALEAIRERKITAAVITGSNLILAPGLTVDMTLLGSLSPEGSSKSFDASADGYARGEAVSALYIKRLDEAIRDGNPIRAVIRSSATNVDGRTNGLSMPNGNAHEALMRQAYDSIGLEMSDTAMVEAHGTGTKVGDPIEAGAIGRCFGKRGVYLGASKPNLGHSESAAALTSVMKAVVSLENRTILPNIKFNDPNPRIEWKAQKLVVPTEPTPWPENKAERIGVNSYGIGGSNVHFIIDSAASFGIKRPQAIQNTEPQTPRKRLLLFSANHEESLGRVAANVKDYLVAHPDRLDDTAYTLAQRREHLKLRSFSVFQGPLDPLEMSAKIKYRGPTKAAFVFTGQGAQWVHMGRDLIREYPSFLNDIRTMDKILQGLRHAPSWSIEDILLNSGDKDLLSRAEFSQPLCTALQVGLVNLLATWNVTASAVVGHSSGEIAAAYAAGALSARDAIIAAFYRGYVCKTAKRRGGMAAVGLGRDQVLPYIVRGVRIACENSGASVTISGDLDALEEVMSAIKTARPEVFVRRLQVEMAYHSQHMTLVGDEYRDLIGEHLTPQPPKVPFYSSVRAKTLRQASDFGPRYWQENLENPVLFHSAVTSLLGRSSDCKVHLEIGPHAALSGPLRQIYKEKSTEINYASALVRGKDDTVSFLQAVGQLHSYGVKISYPHSAEEVLSDLPSYPWYYEKKLWAETRVQKNWRFRQHLPHDLLGIRIYEGSDINPTWRNVLRTVNVPWLNDHCVGDDTVFPAAGYIAIAGEAMFQISDVRQYTVRNVEINKALVLYNDKPVEILTSFQPQRLTSTTDSEWYTFQIVSHDGTSWSKHCSGLVRSGQASPSPAIKTHSFSRRVSSQRWYTTMARAGLNYAGKFARLENITADVVEPIASAEMTDEQDTQESYYAVHPSTLDLVFQSLTVAKAQGIYRNFNTLFLPTFIEELFVGNGKGRKIHITTSSNTELTAVKGASYGISDGEFVYSLTGFHGKSMPNSGIETVPELKTLQLQWKPHAEFLKTSDLMRVKTDARPLIKMLERLQVLCAIETRSVIVNLTAAEPHFEKFRSWLNSEYERSRSSKNVLVEDSAALVDLDSNERRHLIQQVLKDCESAGGWAPANALYRGYAHAADIFEGKVRYLDVVLEDGVFGGIYSWYNDLWDLKDYTQLLGHTSPQMKILEVGAGTGGLTAKFLEHLQSDYGERLYLKYTYTDISAGFFIQAKERFKDYEGIDYEALDISKDPLEQGFNAGEYDLIIASNVLHATPFLDDSLKHVRSLLKPGGQLLLQELHPVTHAMSSVMGFFADWWSAEQDGRAGCPLLSPESWDKRLRDAGFTGCCSINPDYEAPYTWMTNIIAKPIVEVSDLPRVTLLSRSTRMPFVLEVENILRQYGIDCDLREWGQELPLDQDIISFMDLEQTPLLKDIGHEDLTKLLQLVDDFQQSNILWLMPAAQISPTDPHAGQILGMARTLRLELAATIATLEMDNLKSGAAKAVVDVLKKVQVSREDEGELEPDLEWAWSHGALNVSRFHWKPIKEDLCATIDAPRSTGLTIRTPGLLQTLAWTNQELEDTAAGHVHVKMTAYGLNHRDIMLAAGHDVNDIADKSFGLEGVGYVTKVGAGVTNLATGDRVMTVGSNAAGMSTVVRRPAELCVRIPEQLSDDEAATMPLAYITVLICLVEKWKVYRGQSILIHSAAGGIGICAINVAKWLGAEIYATVSSDEKAHFLVQEFGIPRSHIFNSRDNSFLSGLMKATNGVGVDLVLNSLSGELLATSWECVAPEGAMIQIGKRDMAERGQLALAPFAENRTFIGIDVTRYMSAHQSKVANLLNLLVENYLAGNFKPITPVTTFATEDIVNAFQYMQAGTHMGKVVVKFSPDSAMSWTPTAPSPSFRSNATYVLVGGLGGLGKAIAGWMVSHGARDLMFLSRSGGTSVEDEQFFQELKLMGCTTSSFAVDISDAKILQNAIYQASLPIAGVMHMAMVLADQSVFNMDLKTWNKAVQPKVQGAWNLHNLLPKTMDFFILFSSVTGAYGNYGQSNYASANTFLDSFAQYRHSLGLSASVLSIGPVDDVGVVSQSASTRERLIQTMSSLITETQFLDTLQLAIARSPIKHAPNTRSGSSPYSGFQAPNHIFHFCEQTKSIMDPENGVLWKPDPRMSIYRNIQKLSKVENTSSAGQLKQFLSSVSKEPSRLDQKASADYIAKELADRVANFLMKGDEELDASLSLTAAGVDSLVTIEIRNWWRQNLGIEVSILELLGGKSIEQLGMMATERLKVKYMGR